MKSGSEQLILARPTRAWPAPVRVEVDSKNERAAERLNTPFRRTLVFLLARSRGGENRCRILRLLLEQGPLNANQIASSLGLHYTTVKHHLDKLLAKDVVSMTPRGDSYGALFFLTYQMERNLEFFEEILPIYEKPQQTDDARTNRVPSIARFVTG
jgi:DNA-binding transcriptional ArsR family regulator